MVRVSFDGVADRGGAEEAESVGEGRANYDVAPCKFASAHDAFDGKNSVGMHFHSTPGRPNGGIKVDSTESPPPRRVPGHGGDQPGSSAGQGEGKRRPDKWKNLADALRNSGLLGPDERPILWVRKHPQVLMRLSGLVLLLLLAAALLSSYVTSAGKNGIIFNITLFHHVEKAAGQSNSVILGIWLVWLLLFLYLIYKVRDWFVSYFVMTDRQMILISGLLARRFASVPISKMASWYLRESFRGRRVGYKSLVFKLDDNDRVVRTVGYIPSYALETLEEALSSTPREAADEEAFKNWDTGGLRRRVRLVTAVLLICLLVVLAVAAVTVPRIRDQLNNEAQIIALIPILIVLITPKN